MENNDPTAKKRRSADSSSEMAIIDSLSFEECPELYKKQQQLYDLDQRKNYYKKCSMRQTDRINSMFVELKQKDAVINQLAKSLEDKNLELTKLNDEFNQKSKGMIDEYIERWRERETELENELRKARAQNQDGIDHRHRIREMAEQNSKLISELNEFRHNMRNVDQFVRAVNDREKKYLTEIQMLKTNQDKMAAINAKLSEKIEFYETQANVLSSRNEELKNCKEIIDDLNEKIKRLMAKRIDDRRVNETREKVERKLMYEKANEELNLMDKEILGKEKIIIDKENAIRALNKDINALKSQKKYFEEQNDHHKRQLLGAVQTIVKSRDLYVNSIRKVGKEGMDVTEEFAQKIVEVILQFKEQARDEHLAHLSNIVANNLDKMVEIESAEKKIMMKRTDKRVVLKVVVQLNTA